MTKRCLVWGLGSVFYKHFNTLKYYEEMKQIKIIGVTSRDYLFENYLGIKYYSKQELKNLEYDILIVASEGNNALQIISEANAMGITNEKIILSRAFLSGVFEINKYLLLKKNVPTIFSNNCWGGITYNRLGLEFESPFINMYVKDKYYLKFLKKPQKYINETLECVGLKYAPLVDKYYPLCMCADVELRFNHYDDFESANNIWEKRKKRINWDNVFVMMMTEDRNVAKEFCELPYKKKICFVPFKTDEKSLMYIDMKNKTSKPFWEVVIDMAKGNVQYYNPIDLLLNDI